ncbi:MAG: 4-hydroxythreonine-4-phosphate dehydrogenase [Synechococcus sp. MED-G71]|nr:MAG: 4-hydroxythreonine-4-phosphate dehydrogenase [Synechococcus sp. MED-G71]
MLRLLLLALLLIGLATGFQRGWLEVRWDRLGRDLEQQLNPAEPVPR